MLASGGLALVHAERWGQGQWDFAGVNLRDETMARAQLCPQCHTPGGRLSLQSA